MFWRKHHAARHDQPRFSFSEKRESGDRVGSRIVGVDDSRIPLPGDGPQLAGRADIPFASQSKAIGGQAGLIGPPDERRAGRCNDEGTVAEIAQPGCQKKYLTLAATPAAPGIDVKNPGQFHYASICFAKALNSPRSHGSAESVISSGCHWTAITHQSSSVDSIPSMTPSGERAVTRIPSATRFTDW